MTATHIVAFGASVAVVLALTFFTPSAEKGEGILQAKVAGVYRPG